MSASKRSDQTDELVYELMTTAKTVHFGSCEPRDDDEQLFQGLKSKVPDMDTVPGVALFGYQPCGCCTRMDFEPQGMLPEQLRELADLVEAGGSIRFTAGDAAADALAATCGIPCPHDPIGWGRHKGKRQPNPDIAERAAIRAAREAQGSGR